MSGYKYGSAKRDFTVFAEEVRTLLRLPQKTDLATALSEMERVTSHLERLTGWIAERSVEQGFESVDCYLKQASKEEKDKGFGK